MREQRGVAGTTGMLQSGIPEDAFAAFATYQLQVPGALGGLQVGGGVRYTGKSFADDENTGVNTSVALFDALVAYDFVKLDPRFNGVRAQVNATNVFNRYYTTCIEGDCYRGQPAQVIGSLIYRW